MEQSRSANLLLLSWLGFAKNISHYITELVFIYSAVSV
jgi:hypothetical protein